MCIHPPSTSPTKGSPGACRAISEIRRAAARHMHSSFPETTLHCRRVVLLARVERRKSLSLHSTPMLSTHQDREKKIKKYGVFALQKRSPSHSVSFRQDNRHRLQKKSTTPTSPNATPSARARAHYLFSTMVMAGGISSALISG